MRAISNTASDRHPSKEQKEEKSWSLGNYIGAYKERREARSGYPIMSLLILCFCGWAFANYRSRLKLSSWNG
jgi:hypothetical protein